MLVRLPSSFDFIPGLVTGCNVEFDGWYLISIRHISLIFPSSKLIIANLYGTIWSNFTAYLTGQTIWCLFVRAVGLVWATHFRIKHINIVVRFIFESCFRSCACWHNKKWDVLLLDVCTQIRNELCVVDGIVMKCIIKCSIFSSRPFVSLSRLSEVSRTVGIS